MFENGSLESHANDGRPKRWCDDGLKKSKTKRDDSRDDTVNDGITESFALTLFVEQRQFK